MHQHIALEATVYFGFAANLTTGAAGDGATPLYDVRLCGAAAGAAPVLSGTPTLLTHANYTDGLHEVAIAATAANGFAAGNTYLVFATLTIDGVTPASCIGSFTIAPVPANVTQWLGTAAATPTVAGVPEVDVTHLLGTAWLSPGTAGTPDVNVKLISGDSVAADNLEAAADGTGYNLGGGAVVAASVTGAVGSVTGAVGSVTGNVGGNVAGSVASVTAGVTLAASAVQAIWDALTSALTTAGSIGKLLVDNINATISSRLASASYTAPLDAAGTRTAVGLASANLDTQFDALPTAAENTAAVLAGVIEGSVSLKQSLQLANAANAGKLSGAATTTVNIRDLGDTKNRVSATVDADGNRSAVTVSYD